MSKTAQLPNISRKHSSGFRSWRTLSIIATLSLPLLEDSALANGINRDGVSSRAMSLGGTDVAAEGSALDALHRNPAGLNSLDSTSLQLGVVSGFADADYHKTGSPDGGIESSLGALPEFALGVPIKSTPLTLGLSLSADSITGATWVYNDAPSAGRATSYGVVDHRSKIALIRAALGASYKINEKLSVGGSVGLAYNRNLLQAPYIFQTQAALQGLKTMLDLKTDGYGVNGNVGLLYKPTDEVAIGLSYQSPTSLTSEGTARGDVTAENLGLPSGPNYRYDAEVDNNFPQEVSLGVVWKINPRLRAQFQIDWINWSDAFDELHVRLANGSNASINGVVGGNGDMEDVIPLNWKDTFVYRAGLEYDLCQNFTLRGGYAYGASPVPSDTLTPLTAAINEHTLTTGIGWKRGNYSVDAAYQIMLPAEQSVGASSLRAAEYSNSTVSVTQHRFAITAGVGF